MLFDTRNKFIFPSNDVIFCLLHEYDCPNIFPTRLLIDLRKVSILFVCFNTIFLRSENSVYHLCLYKFYLLRRRTLQYLDYQQHDVALFLICLNSIIFETIGHIDKPGIVYLQI